jgi:hypothetical protein
MTEDEFKHILDQRIVNPLLVISQAIGDIKEKVTSLTDNENHRS